MMTKSVLLWFVVAFFCLDATAGIIIAMHAIASTNNIAKEAKALSEQNAVTIANFSKSPFSSVTLDTISINGGPAIAPSLHALYVHPCDWIGLVRSATVLEDAVVSVGRSIQGPIYSLPLLAGSEHFYVAKNPNVMRPLFQVPSNVPRYEYLTYDVFLQDVSRPSPALQLKAVHFFIIDVNQPIPKPGEPIPAGPGPNDPAGPSCLASSITLPARSR